MSDTSRLAVGACCSWLLVSVVYGAQVVQGLKHGVLRGVLGEKPTFEQMIDPSIVSETITHAVTQRDGGEQ